LQNKECLQNCYCKTDIERCLFKETLFGSSGLRCEDNIATVNVQSEMNQLKMVCSCGFMRWLPQEINLAITSLGNTFEPIT